MTPQELVRSHTNLLQQPAHWAVDIRHVLILHELLLASRAKTYLEIGVGFGVSAIAAIEAIPRSDEIRKVYFFDTKIQSVIKDLCRRVGGIAEAWEGDSVDLLASLNEVDFAFLDGNHSEGHINAEWNQLRRLGAKHVAIHDTAARARAASKGWDPTEFAGPELLLERLKNDTQFCVMEDRVDRPSEGTGRGFAFATRDAAFGHRAVEIFSKWTNHPYIPEFNCRYSSTANSQFLPGL